LDKQLIAGEITDHIFNFISIVFSEGERAIFFPKKEKDQCIGHRIA
jgi:hypothetical protein